MVARLRVVALPVLALFVALPPSTAGACLWDGSEELNEAQELLAARDYVEAANVAMGTKYASVAWVSSKADDIPFDLQRVAALAIVRSAGKATVFRKAGYDAEHRARVDLAWAQLVLTYRVAMGFDDPRDLADLAEALAADPHGRARARAILRGLADKDVMPTDEGTELLARLDREAHA